MDILVGYTGFVGSNIILNHKFDKLYNSKNIEDSYNENPDLLVYAGVRAEKFLANKKPEKDLENVEIAIKNIKSINPKKLVLISTIDVYKNPVDVDEDTKIDTSNLHPYGLNRYYLEEWVENNLNNYTIIRLPALYGINIKKNFIFDLINIFPSMLDENKYNKLNKKDNFISRYYELQDNGFYKCRDLISSERKILRNYFINSEFNALNFTDSRGKYQFYNLKYLWSHIEICLKNDIRKMNIAVEPIIIFDLYKYIRGSKFVNEFSNLIPNYNFITKYYKMFNGKSGYIFNKEFIFRDIKSFILNYNEGEQFV